MKLIFIYGPPAVGKLTIGQKLSTSAYIPLFHNHLSRDLVSDIYPDNLLEHYDLVDKIRLDVLTHCARHDTDIIFTYVYENGHDDQNIKDFASAIESNGGEVVFIELTASAQDLLDRVDNKSRRTHKKLTDRTIMKDMTMSLDKFSIPFVESLRIDTSKLDPHQSVQATMHHLGLLT